jgi:hypothetical protein
MAPDIRKLLMGSVAALALSLAPASAQNAETSTENPAETTAPAGEEASEAEIISLPDWHPELTLETAWSVENVLDFDVYGPTGEEIGSVENVLFGTEGEVLSIIAEVGGVWDIGDTHVNVPWDEVDVDPAAERLAIPVTQETIEDYSLWADEQMTATEAQTDLEAVEGDNLGTVETGPRAWRAAELINDYARLRDGDGWVNYGYVDDILVQDGQITAVVVRPDVTWGTPGLYAYPYYGYGYGWTPGLGYYDMPYERADVEALEPLDADAWDD